MGAIRGHAYAVVAGQCAPQSTLTSKSVSELRNIIHKAGKPPHILVLICWNLTPGLTSLKALPILDVVPANCSLWAFPE